MNGFLNLNKPFGLTSHDCVARVRRLLQTKRVGHGGTLDPAAIGVLPIAVGRATRLLQYLSHDKAYRATIRFGIRTATDDMEGEVLAAAPCPQLTLPEVEKLLPQFLGKVQQIPPSYSAIQVGGKRLYDLARAGIAVDVPVRTVEIYRIEILDWRAASQIPQGSGDYPELDVMIACGTGTYIRAIARDWGDLLNVGGTLSALERTLSSGFELTNSLTLEALAEQIEAGTFAAIAPDFALRHIPPLTLEPETARRWSQGQKIAGDDAVAIGFYQIRHEDGSFLGIGEQVWVGEDLLLLPKLVWGE
jgi:tRNA pseudouridine55 synthase